jgi:hypothetical protein
VAESRDVLIGMRLLDHARRHGFQFQPVDGGPDGALLGTRDREDFTDIVFLAGFSRDCYALRQRTSSLSLDPWTYSVIGGRVNGESAP